MISTENYLPLIDHGGRRLVPLDGAWLAESIYRVANHHGHSAWWAQQVAKVIIDHLENDGPGMIITADDIRTTVCHVLRKIGAEDVAQSFRTLPPRIRISLATLAREARAGFELEFFNRLRRVIEQGLGGDVSCLVFTGMKSAVKYLSGLRKWRRRCRELESEILGHIEGVVAAKGRGREVRILVV
jgi:hypothetical protein